MAEVNLLQALPQTKRNIQKRKDAKDPEIIAIAKQFGQMYFDGPREYGYGGYQYDGRWIPVAKNIVTHFGLKPGMRVLDVGCAKGFLVKDLMEVCPGLEVFGIDISSYAISNCPDEVAERLVQGNCISLPFSNHEFDAVIALNVLHNLERRAVKSALLEIIRVCNSDKMFIQVDSYLDDNQRHIFLDWVLTAQFHDFPAGWLQLFGEVGYKGDWYWTIVTE